MIADIADFIKKTDFDGRLKNLDKKFTSNKTKNVQAENELNELSKEVKLLSAKYYSFLLGRMYFTSDDGSQSMLFYQPTLNMLELKKDKSNEYVIGWKSKGVYNSKLIALHGDILPNIKYFRKKIRIQFNNTPLVVEQKNNATKIVNAYIVYHLDN